MRSIKAMKTAKIGYIIMSVILCILGILMIALPDVFVPAAAKACGIILILFGMVKLVGYFSGDLFRLAFQYDLASGLLLALLGILMIIRPGRIMTFISIALGVYILADGLLKIQIALDAKDFGIRKWWLILFAAVLTGIIGFLLILRPSESMEILMMLVGLSLLAEGILNLITVLAAVRIIRHQRPDQIDIEYCETGEEKL